MVGKTESLGIGSIASRCCIVTRFVEAPLLMDTRKQRVKRGDDYVKDMDGARTWNSS